MSEFNPQHSLAALGSTFSLPCSPTPVAAPEWLAFNQPLANELALPEQYHASELGLALFAGNNLPQWCQPIAQAYAGHQFANYVPRLGDGRAILLADVKATDGQLYDIQLKGAGPTPFSRGGDGRSPIGPVIREYLVSEAMHALGVPTTRALAAVSTGETVYREEALPGAIITRVAKSHIRIGTFQYVAALGDTARLTEFTDYVIARHYPQCTIQQKPYLKFLQAVIAAQAATVAHWMSLGFIHGVMNTDNMTITGETIDYGPCAFMEAYDEKTVFSSIDRRGRYAYSNQPPVALWNLTRFAETLLPLLAADQPAAIALASSALEAFSQQYQAAYLQRMTAKLGIEHATPDDAELVKSVLALMQQDKVDFTVFFRQLSANTPEKAGELFNDQNSWLNWFSDWQARVTAQKQTGKHRATAMQRVNPELIPRNHLVQQAIEQVTRDGDLSLFNQLKQAWLAPFDADPAFAAFSQPASEQERVQRTFCGT
ncbi:protein adenylyltransferase SelO [Arsukibacterium sp. UBA3155]|uniref:protein adenylyltransferase SelO n=1 Tax=Arsukibacterium sp. UBA3155 TaxID=1946058 RepID=UPI0025B97C41|nr:YdiU family protein [Arsukibacterium sp. UBA3155]|tara:strand:+ start:4275 stop:5735 length:1461 start_codon:yes stop_codon:yes gene_type:complete